MIIYVTSFHTVDLLVTITPTGNNTAGGGYSLVCSTRTTTALTGQPNITWLDPMNNEVMSATGSMSTLTFNPLTASAAGKYTCRATLSSKEETAEVMVTVHSECLVTLFFVDHKFKLER